MNKDNIRGDSKRENRERDGNFRRKFQMIAWKIG